MSQSEVDQSFFFHIVSLCGTRCGAGAGGALYGQDGAISCDALQSWLNEGESAHVGRLFLYPDDFSRARVLVESGLQLYFGPGIELLDEYDADAHVLALSTLDAEVVADL